MDNQVTAPSDAVLSAGTILNGTYQIVRPLAEGGGGELYVAGHTRLPGQFAVKVLHGNVAKDPELLSRFRCEAAITSELRHPHVVQVVDFNVSEEGIPYLVMELLEGELLTKRIAARGPLEPRAVVRIVEQIAHALQAAHTLGIVHRDLKPDNVMLLFVDGRDDFVKVVDFGISHSGWSPRPKDVAHVLMGTPRFMSPEQARGLGEAVDHQTDQFSLAAIAYTLLTGCEPFSGDDLNAVLDQVVHGAPTPPSQRIPGLGGAVDRVLARGLSKNAANRYPDIVTFARALREAIDQNKAAPSWEDRVDWKPRGVPFETRTVPFGARTVDLMRQLRRRPNRLGLFAVVAAAGMIAWLSSGAWTGVRAAWRRFTPRAAASLLRIEDPTQSHPTEP
jgi:eukaryotic-like serine/threonine-protein kinase